MVLHTFEVNLAITATPLTPQLFAPFGGVMSADHQIAHAQSLAANYGTATKIHKVAPVVSRYLQCPSGRAASANWNIFRCRAPTHLIAEAAGAARHTYTAKVLERHPFSTQTFVPMALCLDRAYLVIVARSHPSTQLPDPASAEAFVCRGNQSVTYGVGTWHAPMVVIDASVAHIDFAVLVHENGVPDEDCQECYLEPGVSVYY